MINYRLMAPLPRGTYDNLAQNRVTDMLAQLGRPFATAEVLGEQHWLPVESLLAPAFRWPAELAPTAWLDRTGLTWLHLRHGDGVPDALAERLDDLQAPWFGLNGPRDGWTAVPVNATADASLVNPGMPEPVTGDWLVRQAGADRPSTQHGIRWTDAYATITTGPHRGRVTRTVAEQIVAWQARQRRQRFQELLNAGVAPTTAHANVDTELAELRWQGDTLIHGSEPNDIEHLQPADGTYDLPGGWQWYPISHELADTVHE